MRRFFIFLTVVLLVSSCGGNPDEPVVDSTGLEPASTATIESSTPEVAPAAGDMSEGSGLEVAPEPTDAPKSQNSPSSGLDVHSRFSCIISELGEQAAFELNGRTPTPGEQQAIGHCPSFTHDIGCVHRALGAEATDLLLRGRYTLSPEDAEQLKPCSLVEQRTTEAAGTSDDSQVPANSSLPGSQGSSDSDISEKSGLITGSLISASGPTPGYQNPVSQGCSVSEAGACAELRWEPVADLFAGEFTAIQVSPSDPNVIYAGVDSNDMSIYKSVNAGKDWELLHTTGHTSGIAVHPTDPNTVLYTILEGPVQRTNNGGRDWIQVVGKDARSYGLSNRTNPAPEARLFTAIGFSPDEPKFAYTATLTGDHRTGTERGEVDVYLSSDTGLGWRYAGTCETCGAIHEFAISPNNPSEVWVASNNGAQVSRDAGNSWSGNLLPFSGESFKGTYGIAIRPDNPQTILVASQESGMFRSADGGLTWTPTNNGLPTRRLHKVVFAASRTNVAYVTTHEGLFRSDDAGLSWNARNEGLPYTFLTPIAVDPANPDVIYVGTASELVTTHTGHFNDGVHEGEGLYKSTDGGLSWFRSDSGIYEAKSAQLETHPILPFNLWVAGESGRGAFFTPDAGDTWLFAPFRSAHYPMVFAFSRTFPTEIYLTSWMNDGELMKSVDGGSTWRDITEAINLGVSEETRSKGLIDESTRRWFHLHGLAVAPSDPNEIYVGSVHDSVYRLFNLNGAHIFRSSDGGQTFTEASGGFPISTQTSINALVVHPNKPEVAYAMTSLHETSTAIGIYKTTNGGNSWLPVNDGLDPLTNDLQIDPVNPEVLYAATESGIYKTTDGAASWRYLSVDERGTPIIDLAIDPVNPLTLYAISPHNLYRTKDGGETWYATSLGLPLLNEGRAFSDYSTSGHEGHRVYGGTFAQDRTLEIDSTGRSVYVVVKTATFDGREENFAAVRHVYRAIIQPLQTITYSFELGSAIVTIESESNIYNLSFDRNNRELTYTAAGPTGTRSTSTVTIAESLLEGPFELTVDGASVTVQQQENSVSFAQDHSGRSQVTIRGK